MLVVSAVFLILAAAVSALVPRVLLPSRMDEQLAFRLRDPQAQGEYRLLVQNQGGGGLAAPGPGAQTRSACREHPASRLRLLLPLPLFPGMDREIDMECGMPALVDPRMDAPIPGLVPGSTVCARRMRMTAIRLIQPDQVKPLVEQVFLGGSAARLGLLRPLRRLGIDPVRVDLDALPSP
jgi:hypothetical protein